MQSSETLFSNNIVQGTKSVNALSVLQFSECGCLSGARNGGRGVLGLVHDLRALPSRRPWYGRRR